VRALSLLFAAVAWFCSGWALLVGWIYGLGLKCDESCGDQEGWRGDPDAWQWYGLAGLGVLAFASGGALFFFVLLRRPLFAACAVVAGGAAVVLLAGAMSTDWIEHLDRRSGGELLLLATGAFAPILAVLLSVPARRAG
jgi:hypothetical protein